MASLIGFVRRNVDPEKYYKSIFPEVSWSAGSNEAKVLSPFVDEKVPSLSLNRDTGAWYSFCASDERGGSSIISFHVAYYKITTKEAAQDLFTKFIHPVIPNKKIRQWMKKLYRTPMALRYLQSRLLSKKVVQQYRLGWDGKRIVIPIYNEFRLCVNAKLYDPHPQKNMPKMINYTNPLEERSYGSPTMLFPLSALLDKEKKEDTLFISEGEWDTLALISIGLSAITSTTGAKTWPSRYNNFFKSRKVIIVYDNDESGVSGAHQVAKQLLGTVKTLQQIKIPQKYGKDVTDYMLRDKRMRKQQSWRSLVEKAKILIDNPEEPVSIRQEAVRVSLDQASQAKWYNQRIQVEALITGKDIAPYLLPQKFRITCSGDCEDCSIAREELGFKEYDIDLDNYDVLTMVDMSKGSVRQKLLNTANLPHFKSCKAKIEILKTFNIERLLLIPTLDSESKEYVVRPAYYIGHGLRANRAYCFEGTLVAEPKSQHTAYLFDLANPIQDEIETFELSEPAKKELLCFRPKHYKHLAHLNSIAEWQSRNITKILERPDLHIAVDLAFHSVQAFWFNKEYVSRGMLDILILGDTRCGKGYVTEGLSKFYGLGEIASGDNCSFAGLVGGLQQTGNNWRITWGLIPLNNKRLVIIDETSSMEIKDIARMSRIRSEGVAEIVKIIREVTQANTRLIWLANPRSGYPIATYNTGVEAVKELIGAIEDISRFDFVITLASKEVASEIINAPAVYSVEDSAKYPKELCRALILWAWSRAPDQIEFTKKATQEIIKEAIEFGYSYSPVIPLIQAENVRLKLAKVSAAVAARTFSADSSCERLIIKLEHVECAAQILRMFYNKPSMAYDLFSKTTLAASEIEKSKDIKKVLENYSQDLLSVIVGLLESQRINSDNLSDYIGDIVTAKSLIGELVQLRCLIRLETGNWYVKNPDFTKWLRKIKKEIVKGTRNE